jgi:putative endopeptidase
VKTLAGVSENRPAGSAAGSGQRIAGRAGGQAYVARHFTPDAKAKMEVLVANLKTAMAHRIETNSWMSPPTKQAALTKLSKMDVMVGYPDVWRIYRR